MPKTLEARLAVTVSVGEIVHSAIQTAKKLPELRGAVLTLSVKGNVKAELIPQVIHTAIVNLLINAAESHPRSRILVKLTTDPTEDNITIELHDDGPGIDTALRSRVMEPRFTTKPFNSGMGLVAVDSATHIHNGRVSISDSDELGGACISLTLPRSNCPADSGTGNS